MGEGVDGGGARADFGLAVAAGGAVQPRPAVAGGRAAVAFPRRRGSACSEEDDEEEEDGEQAEAGGHGWQRPRVPEKQRERGAS